MAEVAEEKAEGQRIGTTDMLLGLVAVISDKVREKKPDIYNGLYAGDWIDGIVHVRQNEQFRPYFEYVDFRREGDSWTSEVLGRLLTFCVDFQGNFSQLMPRERSQSERERIGREYGLKTSKLIETMADEFMKYHIAHPAPPPQVVFGDED